MQIVNAWNADLIQSFLSAILRGADCVKGKKQDFCEQDPQESLPGATKPICMPSFKVVCDYLQVSFWKSVKTVVLVPNENALIFYFWLLGLAPSSLGLQELNFPCTCLSVTHWH